MVTIKIKFEPSTVDGREGKIFYQLIHKREVRSYKTNYSLFEYEWDNNLSEVVFLQNNESRNCYLFQLRENIKRDLRRFKRIIEVLFQVKEYFTVDDIIAEFSANSCDNSLSSFANDIISNLRKLGKIRTSETYISALNSFMKFRNGIELPLEEVNADIIILYEAYLRERGLTPNTSSFYMRNLRALYNKAVENRLVQDRKPFKKVYTGIDKTLKRALSLDVVREIKEFDFSKNPTFDFARDMFLFSFYTRGMAFVDMAYLRKKDLCNGILSYRRRKTGQQLFIKWEKCMQEIVDKYDTLHSVYLLPIINPLSDIDERKQYIYVAQRVNFYLKKIGVKLQLPINITMYVARHSWASIAKSVNIPVSVISESLGHNSETTTQIYLTSIDNTIIDKANNMILDFLG